jgi:hypothetical protein
MIMITVHDVDDELSRPSPGSALGLLLAAGGLLGDGS